MEGLSRSEVNSDSQLFLNRLEEHYADGNAEVPLRSKPELTINKLEVSQVPIKLGVIVDRSFINLIPKDGIVACSDSDPELFFANTSDVAPESEKEKVTRAKQICEICVVKIACLETALENDMRHGIWGGLSQEDRAGLIRQKKRLDRKS